MSMSCHVAMTQRQLDDALRVRWSVFGAELQLLGGPVPPAPREVNCFDTLETTVHLVVYANEVPVATTRLLLPNPEVALATKGHLGIDLEQKLDLSEVRATGSLFAETTRFCILKPWRNSEAILWLQAGLYRESLRRGVTHWIASANTETDSAFDARLLFELARHKGLMSQRWRVQPRAHIPIPAASHAPLYTPSERMRAQQGKYDGLRMPRILSFFAHKLGARFLCEPLYDAGFRRYAMPLVAALDEIPQSTLAHFKGLDVLTAHAA